jgi:hypothetical protein
MSGTRMANAKLAAVIAEARWSHAQTARAFSRVAAENNAQEFSNVGRSHVSKWVAGFIPSGQAPLFLAEALSRRLNRVITLDAIGFADSSTSSPATLYWGTDTLTELIDLGRMASDVDRRAALGAAAFSAAALVLPPDDRWYELAHRSRARATRGSRQVTRADVEAVREMTQLYSKLDQRRGGGHARGALIEYLTSEVANDLTGRFTDDQTRDEMFSAASEAAYVGAWTAFDNYEHVLAQRYFHVSLKLAAEANDPALEGHVLRAMAHQAIELGHFNAGLDLATRSIAGERYTRACPRERALIGVVYAKALAANGFKAPAAAALLKAEDDLSAADPGDDEPSRVFFFAEASLAHETACTLRNTGDLRGAIREFRRSVRMRKATSFTRTHAVTLGYLGSVQAMSGSIDEACATWTRALDAMEGVNSGRTRKVAKDIRATLSPFRRRSLASANEVDERAAQYLRTAQ